MRKIFVPWLLLFMTLAASCGTVAPVPAPGPTAVPSVVPNVLYVDPGADLGPASPYLLGSNYGPWVAVPYPMLDAAYQSKVKAIRFPGGAWGDRNDLKPYHIDPFMAFCKKVGAIPTLSVNLRDGTPEQAADLVRYVNLEKKYGVVYWAIGNEPNLFTGETGEVYDTAQFNADWAKFAEAMKAVDPTIKLLGPELSQYTADPNARPKDSKGLDWMDEFLKANGDKVDVITFHRYPFGTNPSKDDLRRNAREWADILPALRGRMQELTGRELPVAITEVNTNWNRAVGGEATPESHFNAVWLADVVGQMAQQGLFMFNHWMLAAGGGGNTSPASWGMIGRGELRPSYYTYQMYSMFGQKMIYSASGIQDVNIYAAKRPDGTLTLMIVNLSSDARNVPLQLKDRLPSSAQLFLLDPGHSAEDMGTVQIPEEGSLSLPGESVSLYVIHPQ